MTDTEHLSKDSQFSPVEDRDEEVFFSVDIETDGPIPIVNSMISLGCAAFNYDGTLLDTFEVNLQPLESAVQDPDTMNFWEKNQEAWNHSTSNPVDPREAMRSFSEWVHTTAGGRPKVAVCFPAGFDFTFLYVYFKYLGLSSPFGFSCVDMKTYASATLKNRYGRSGKGSWPNRWFDKGLPHTHKAIDDALEQGLTFMKMRAELLSGKDAAARVGENFWRENKHVKRIVSESDCNSLDHKESK